MSFEQSRAPQLPADDAPLVEAARGGDRHALQRLYACYLPTLRQWARTWLPRGHGGINDADDLVQTALMRTLQRLGAFEVRGNGAFLGYLHRALLNEVRAELRRGRRRMLTLDCIDEPHSGGNPTADHMLELEREHTLAAALRTLKPRQRRHLHLRVTLGMSFGEIAACVGGSTDGARMTVTRAIRNMAQNAAAISA